MSAAMLKPEPEAAEAFSISHVGSFIVFTVYGSCIALILHHVTSLSINCWVLSLDT